LLPPHTLSSTYLIGNSIFCWQEGVECHSFSFSKRRFGSDPVTSANHFLYSLTHQHLSTPGSTSHYVHPISSLAEQQLRFTVFFLLSPWCCTLILGQDDAITPLVNVPLQSTSSTSSLNRSTSNHLRTNSMENASTTGGSKSYDRSRIAAAISATTAHTGSDVPSPKPFPAGRHTYGAYSLSSDQMHVDPRDHSLGDVRLPPNFTPAARPIENLDHRSSPLIPMSAYPFAPPMQSALLGSAADTFRPFQVHPHHSSPQMIYPGSASATLLTKPFSDGYLPQHMQQNHAIRFPHAVSHFSQSHPPAFATAHSMHLSAYPSMQPPNIPSMMSNPLGHSPAVPDYTFQPFSALSAFSSSTTAPSTENKFASTTLPASSVAQSTTDSSKKGNTKLTIPMTAQPSSDSHSATNSSANSSPSFSASSCGSTEVIDPADFRKMQHTVRVWFLLGNRPYSVFVIV
jgi:hypothetical protein